MGSLFCSHKWVILSNDRDDSPVERIQMIEGDSIPAILFQATRVQNLACEKCGKLKHFVEKV